MIHNLQTQRGRTMAQFVEEKLLERAVPPEMWPRDETAAGPSLKARIDYGRWLVDCPFCPNANLVDLTDLRTFCCLCFNAQADYRWLAIEVPESREAIEEALDDGRAEHAVTWQDGMSLDDLATGSRPAELPHPEMLAQLAQSAGEQRDRLIMELEAARAAHGEEQSGALRLIREIERLRLEASIRKQLNRDLQDQLDALAAPHSHEN